MKSKSGALELSMTTIIVIVIGVVLLSLGLMFVRGIFEKITDESDQIFAMSEEQISELFEDSNSLIKIVPETADAEIGETLKTGIVIKNQGGTLLEFSLFTETSPGVGNAICTFDETLTSTSDTHTLAAGVSKKFKLIADLDNSLPGQDNCKVTVNVQGAQLGEYDNTGTFLIFVSA